MAKRRFNATMGSLMEADVRDKLLGLRQQVPQRKRHLPTQLGNARRSAIPFMAYIDRRCPAPIRGDELAVTREWALGCFLPAYWSARGRVGRDPGAIAKSITQTLASRWVKAPRMSPGAAELERRIRLAVAVLLRQDGTDVEMPEEPGYPAPSTEISPSWVHALLTGWP